MIGWIVKPETIRKHTNSISYFKIGKWWDMLIKYVTPVILLIMVISSLINEFRKPYGGYSIGALFIYGWCIIALGIIGALLISRKPWKNKGLVYDESEEVTNE